VPSEKDSPRSRAKRQKTPLRPFNKPATPERQDRNAGKHLLLFSRSLEAMKIPGSVALVLVAAGAPQGGTGFTVNTAALRKAGAGVRSAGNMRMAGEGIRM